MKFSWESVATLIIGSIVSWYLARRFASTKKINYWIESYPVFSRESLSGVEGFDVKFNGRQVRSVHRHALFFWNGGNQPIWLSDILDNDPLRFTFSERANLFVDEIVAKSVPLTVDLEVKRNELFYQFPSLDAGHGAWVVVFEALEEDASYQRPSFNGHVVGLTKPAQQVAPSPRSDAFSKIKFGLGCLTLLMLGTVGLTLTAGGWEALWPPSGGWLVPIVLIAVIAVSSDVFGLGSLLRARQSRTPDEFANYRTTRFRLKEPLEEAIDDLANAR